MAQGGDGWERSVCFQGRGLMLLRRVAHLWLCFSPTWTHSHPHPSPHSCKLRKFPSFWYSLKPWARETWLPLQSPLWACPKRPSGAHGLWHSKGSWCRCPAQLFQDPFSGVKTVSQVGFKPRHLLAASQSHSVGRSCLNKLWYRPTAFIRFLIK